MADDVRIWLSPMLTLLGMLIVVVFTAWLNTRVLLSQIETVKAQIEVFRAEMKKEIAELRLELKTEIAALSARIKALEDRASVIYRA